MKTQGVQGILQFQHDTKASPSICKAGPAGRAGVRDRHPAAAVPDLVHGRRQRLRRLRGRREGRRDGRRRSGTASTTPGSRSSSPRSARRTTQRMGGYRKGFQSVCPGAIKNLKKVGFDATLDKARTMMTDVLTTLPGQAAHHRRVDRRRGHRGRVRRREVGRPSEGRLGHLARRRRQGRQVRDQDQPELARRRRRSRPEKYGWTAIPT